MSGDGYITGLLVNPSNPADQAATLRTALPSNETLPVPAGRDSTRPPVRRAGAGVTH